MATESSRPHSNSTPKNNPAATPTHLTSSPHPSASAAMARGLSHKSPSTKTPASLHGHNHHLSASSHQYSTPLAAATSIDDIPMSSPSAAALVAMGLTGITPSPGAANGLARSGSSLQAMDISGLGIAGGVRDSEEERMRNIEEVVRLIGTHAAGRGVSREGVMLIGQGVGSDCMWDENTLSIAGNRILVDIEFDPHDRDLVKGTHLSFPTSSGGGSSAEDAAKVLKGDLTQTAAERQAGMWKSMTAFKTNLERLARLDRLSAEVNCFQAIEGLYESMRKIWDAERKRSKKTGPWEGLCKGSLGRPVIHQGKTVGLSLEYWAENRRILDLEKNANPSDDMEIDNNDSEDFHNHNDARVWSAVLECEQCPAELYPSVRIATDWVSEQIFQSIHQDAQSDEAQPMGPENTYIEWLEPLPTFGSPSQLMKDGPDAMVLDSTIMNGHKSPDVRFVAKFEPAIVLPWPVAFQIHQIAGINLPHDGIQLIHYEDMIFSSGVEPSVDIGAITQQRRRSITIFDQKGNALSKKHSYTLYTYTKDIGHQITQMPFSHPRQLADMMPLLRQYALLSNLIKYTFLPESSQGSSSSPTESSPTKSPPNTNGSHTSSHVDDHCTSSDSSDSEDENGTKTISNQPPLLSTLETLLKSSSPNQPPSSWTPISKTISLPHSTPSTASKSNPPRSITITLSTTPTNTPTITIKTPVTTPPSSYQNSSSPLAYKSSNLPAQARTQLLEIRLCVLPNGVVTVPSFRIPSVETDESFDADGDASDETEKSRKLRGLWTKRIVKAVEILGRQQGLYLT